MRKEILRSIIMEITGLIMEIIGDTEGTDTGVIRMDIIRRTIVRRAIKGMITGGRRKKIERGSHLSKTRRRLTLDRSAKDWSTW